MDHIDQQAQEISLKLFVVLSKAYKSLMEQASRDIRGYGLSVSEFAILEALYNKGRLPLQQIGEKILLTSGTMTYNIDKLEKRSLLKRLMSKEDRRVIFAELTPEGKALFDDIFPRHSEFIHGMMNGLDEAQKQETIRLVKALGKGPAD